MRLAIFLISLAFCIPVRCEDPPDLNRQLVAVKRIYVDKLTGGETAAQIRDMLMSSLQSAKLWVITENPEKADAFLRGAADDMVFSEVRESHDGIGARGSIGTRDSDYVSSNARGNRMDRYASAGVTQNEGSRVQEHRHEATAALRLVNKDGDLIWSTTKESSGAKFRGSAADVADKVVKQLVADLESARRPTVPSQQNPNSLPR